MITFRVGDAKGACAQRASGLRQGCRGRQGRTRNLEQNLRCGRQGAANRYESTTRTHIECSGELEKLLSLLIAATDENGDCQGQSRPLPTFLLGFAPNQ
jgi:hypothetical protein